MRPRVIVVGFEQVQTLDVTGPAEVFAAVGRRLGRPHYEVLLASIGGGPRTSSSGIGLATRDLRRLRPRPTDIVVVAGGEEPAIRDAIATPGLLGWLRRALPIVRRMTSVCSGAFLLAAAGILDHLRATTHWSACDALAHLHPTITVDPNAIFIEQGKVWTSAGVTTGIDMALAIVEQDLGAELADAVAAQLVLYVRRPGFQSQFSDALVSQASTTNPLGPAIAWARANLAKADVDSLARRAGLSVRTLHRRCHELLGTTPRKLLEKLRVEHARTLISTRSPSSKSLAHHSGFGNPTRMHRAFLRELGIAPRDYRVLHERR